MSGVQSSLDTATHEDGSLWDYAYDDHYRLTSAVRKNASETIAASYAYTYDAGDNLLTKVEPFEDDFNDGNYTGWSAWSGTWSAANNYLRMTPGAAGTIAKANTDNDNELRFSYVCNDTSNAGYTLTVSPRYASSGDRIYVEIRPGSINLSQRVSAVWSSLDTSATSSTQGTEYTIRVVCDGQDVKVYRTAPGALEELVLETTSCIVASTNYVSFTPSAGADYSIDNIRILADGLSNTTTFAVNNANELTSMSDFNGSTTFGFDAWGRMTGKARGSYEATYDYRYGQMLRSVTSDFPGEGDVTYEYGGDGKRRQRSTETTTTYNWSGFAVINEESAGGSLSRLYIDRTFAHVDGTSPATGNYVYYAHDNIESSRSLWAQDKAPIANSEWEPYGGQYSSNGAQSVHGFTGLEWDSQSNLHFAPFRYFSSDQNTWIARDPIGVLDGFNMYGYVGENPTRFVDILGLQTEQVNYADLDLRGQLDNVHKYRRRCLSAIRQRIEKLRKLNTPEAGVKDCKIPADLRIDLGELPGGYSFSPHKGWISFTPRICDDILSGKDKDDHLLHEIGHAIDDFSRPHYIINNWRNNYSAQDPNPLPRSRGGTFAEEIEYEANQFPGKCPHRRSIPPVG